MRLDRSIMLLRLVQTVFGVYSILLYLFFLYIKKVSCHGVETESWTHEDNIRYYDIQGIRLQNQTKQDYLNTVQ